jgi:hypothetical protein
MKERWWEDFGRYAATLIAHVDQIGEACRTCFELEPDLGVLAVDFMSTDFAGHLGYARLDPAHPAHDPAASGDELVQVYQAVDRVCGELIDAARERYGEEPTAIIMSDHGMKPIYWTFHQRVAAAGRAPSLPAALAFSASRAAANGAGRRAAGAFPTWYGRRPTSPFVPRPPATAPSPTSTSAHAPASPPAARSTWARRTGARDDAAFASGFGTTGRSRPRPASRSSRACESATSTTGPTSTGRPSWC